MPNFTESSEATRAWPPSSQPPLLGAGPLRTGRDSFPASGSSPANASFRETRLWNHSLHDTHLESANVTVSGLPVDGIPFCRFA